MHAIIRTGTAVSLADMLNMSDVIGLTIVTPLSC
jgi:hypothetical protein